MENLNVLDEDLTSNPIVEKNNSTNNIKSNGMMLEDVKMSTEDKGKAIEETEKNNRIFKHASKDDAKTIVSGMIFMCNSKTKNDCYQYKVLGLPAGKKEAVSNIYKGMRLFLYDFDLKVMYGIFKAAGKGGYNIEPKAFNSAYPSQVRFTNLEECIPLMEEKFRTVIKDNYYTRNKFNCELTSEQVKKLCKLFQAGSKERSKGGMVGRVLREGGNNYEKAIEEVNFEMRGSFVELARNRFRQWEQKMHSAPQLGHQSVDTAFASPGLGTSFQAPTSLSPLIYTRETTSDRDIYGRNYPLFGERVDSSLYGLPLDEYMHDDESSLLTDTQRVRPTYRHY